MTMFPFFPNSGVVETLEWKTDLIVSHNGIENRMSLRDDPRVTLAATFFLRNAAERVKATRETEVNLKTVFEVPMWQYGSRITATTSTGGNRIYFDPQFMALIAGQPIILINLRTEDIRVMTVSVTEVDGVTLTANVAVDITSAYIAFPGMECVIESYQGTLQQVTGETAMSLKSWVEYPLQGTLTSETIATLNSLPILEQKFLSGSQENLLFKYEIIDNEVGYREYRSRETLVRFNGQKNFLIKRIQNPDQMNYWRVFLETVKGGWKPFLLSTQMNDMTVTVAPVPSATTITVDKPTYSFVEAFRYLEIEFTNGTVIRRRVSSIVDNGATHTLTLSSALPSGAFVANVARISYLLKVRMGDTVRLTHGPFETEVSFEVTATNEG